MSDYKIGQAELRLLKINSEFNNKEVDISSITTHITVYEDLFMHSISCNLNIVDGSSLQNDLPIRGGELVNFDVGEVGGKRNLQDDLVVEKLHSKVRVNPDLEMYSLHLVNKSYLKDSSISINQSYTSQISDIIKKVVESYITPITGKKLITLEETKGIHTMIATGITPLAFIRQLMREAESLTNPSSIYMFYETIEGYHFVTLDKLYYEPPKHRFMYDEVVTSKSTVKTRNNISYFNINESVDLIQGFERGEFRSETCEFDPLTKTLKHNDYSYQRDKKNKINDNKTISAKTSGTYIDGPTMTRFYITDSHRKDTPYIVKNEPTTQNIFRRRQNFAAREQAVLNQYGSMSITVSVPGNPETIVGQTVDLIIPKASDTVSENIENDNLISGKYIITAIAHNINITTNQYATIMECMRPGLEEGTFI